MSNGVDVADMRKHAARMRDIDQHAAATRLEDAASEIERLRKIEKAARWLAVAALDPDAPSEVRDQVVADFLDAFGLTLARK